MANHRRKSTFSLPSLTKRHWIRIAAAAAALALAATGGITARHFWVSAHAGDEAQQITSFSATDPLAVSRGNERTNGGETSYVTVKLDGESRTVLGTDFTTIKSVLEAGNITLGPDDTVDPALDTEVDESTVITIETAGSALETSEEPIAFSTVKKETSALPEGTEQVQTEGEEGVMETTSLVTRADKVILVGTGSTASSTASGSSSSSGSGSSSSASTSIGTTVPAGEMQQWAHDNLLAIAYTEADISATV